MPGAVKPCIPSPNGAAPLIFSNSLVRLLAPARVLRSSRRPTVPVTSCGEVGISDQRCLDMYRGTAKANDPDIASATVQPKMTDRRTAGSLIIQFLGVPVIA